MLFGYSVTDIVIILVSLLVAMTVHEAVHAYVGYYLGDSTAADQGRVSLNPLKHIDPITTLLLPAMTLILFHAPILAARPVPFNPERVRYGEYGAAIIAAAGPMANLLLAVIGSVLFRFTAADLILDNVLYIFVSLNVALFIFNLIPIPPLDGSRVLYAFAPEPLQRLMAQVEQIGLVIIFALVLVGGFGGMLANLNQFVLRILL